MASEGTVTPLTKTPDETSSAGETPKFVLEGEVIDASETPDSVQELKAIAQVLEVLLSSPAVMKGIESVAEYKKAQAEAQVQTIKEQGANADAAHKRQVEVANAFLTKLAALGISSMGLLAFIAWTKILDGQAFGVLASTFITVLFGSGIYGTSIRNKAGEKP